MTPATIEFEGGYDEEQAGLFPTRFVRHVNRSETSRVPHKLLAERDEPRSLRKEGGFPCRVNAGVDQCVRGG